MLKAVIFDVDGTLIDSVDLHAHAWQDMFARYGHQIPFDQIRHQIGKGGDQLMPVFLSKEELEEFLRCLKRVIQELTPPPRSRKQRKNKTSATATDTETKKGRR